MRNRFVQNTRNDNAIKTVDALYGALSHPNGGLVRHTWTWLGRSVRSPGRSIRNASAAVSNASFCSGPILAANLHMEKLCIIAVAFVDSLTILVYWA